MLCPKCFCGYFALAIRSNWDSKLSDTNIDIILGTNVGVLKPGGDHIYPTTHCVSIHFE